MWDKVNPMQHSDQQLESSSSLAREFQTGKRELTDNEKIDVTAARILKKYREAFLELAK